MQAPDGRMEPRFIGEPAAVIGGPAALLLSRILRSPHIRRVLDTPRDWIERDTIAATVTAIDLAGFAFEASLTARERGETITVGAVAAECHLTTKETADYLRISLRRAQELAPELGGKRIARRWAIPAAGAKAYAERRAAA